MNFVTNFSSVEDIISSYRAPANALDGANVLLAWYGYGDYCGSSYVLFEKDGKLYENFGSHCSCNGLEEQWEPEETTWAALSMRDLYGSDCEGHNEAAEILTALVKEHLN